MLLAGDIGGTKTHLAIFSSKEELSTPLYEEKFASAKYATLVALVQDFLVKADYKVDSAVFGVAGPVIQGKAKVTNLPWIMDEQQLEQALSIPSIRLLNDLAAMAEAVPIMGPTDLYTVNEGKPVSQGTLAIIAPGTGLGEAFLIWDGAHYCTFPSEGGHADFAPTNAFEIGLLIFMLEKFPHVSYEHVCSGIGLPNIYAYIKQSGMFEEPAWLTEQLVAAQDHTPIIVNGALKEPDPVPICVATIKTFLSILGAEAGNLAIKVLAGGGVYLGGGIPLRILQLFKDEDFRQSFRNKGRFSEMLADIPVHVILNPNVGLIGAASYGFSL